MMKLLKYMKGNWKFAIFGGISKFFEAGMELIFPILMAIIIDNGIIPGDSSYIIRYSVLMILVALLATILTTVGQYCAAKAAHGMGENIRDDLYSHIHSLSIKEVNELDTISLINRVNNDTLLVENGVAFFIRLALRCPILIIGAIILTSTLDIPLTLVLIGVIPIIIITLIFILKHSVKIQKEAQKKLDVVSKSVKDNILGLRDIKSYNKTDDELREFLKYNNEWKEYGEKSSRVSNRGTPITKIFSHIAICLIIVLGARRIDEGIMTIGTLVAFISYVNIIVSAIMLFSTLATNFSKTFASSKRINDVFEINPSICYGNIKDTSYKDNTPILEINNLVFGYKNKINLSLSHNIKINKGDTVGIIGSTGCGKSTLAKLLVRLHDPNEGEIILNGVNLKDYSNDTLRKEIAIVMQNDSLLNMSIKDNLNMNNNLNDEQLLNILKISQSYDFVKEKPGFLDYVINEDTKNLSGGQKQRLTIARALAQKPSILILDDSFSALDYQTDYNLRLSLKKEYPNMTKIIVSQRISTIRDCNIILVLNEGRLVGIGKHEELLDSCNIYQQIQDSQKKVNTYE